jgi:uncharacterized RDD family membrane protein YckC
MYPQEYRGLDDLLGEPMQGADLGKRFFAGVVDYCITQATLFFITLYAIEDSKSAWLEMFLLSIVFNWFYSAGMESSQRQGTIGKILMNIKVTDLYGRRVSFFVATNRHFAKYLSALLLFIGYAMILFDAKNQGLHDKIADTLVIQS